MSRLGEWKALVGVLTSKPWVDLSNVDLRELAVSCFRAEEEVGARWWDFIPGFLRQKYSIVISEICV